ncbi:MAG: ABC transporter permease [Sphingobacterium sp.]|jgi:lipoprotein-releasing system permease protein|uniref:FtsX-like permease family protein n=1 Tax=Sphingobacterium sp. TaxID=341027 RepID=UPI002836ABDB|nr:FtsX-like permease family protein [Sphingobacterium sp.]MDR0264382.1 ABC transporter permease [Sphingobacterium sp.]
MNLPFLFAKRYLFSKKSVNAINIISSISVIGVMVSSAALIILLSSFNGMEQLILSMYSKFAPELKIEPKKGKLFDSKQAVFNELRKDPNVIHYTEVLQEKVLLQYSNRQFIANIKGIEPQSLSKSTGDSITVDGQYKLTHDSIDLAILGASVQANLAIPMQNSSELIQVYSPRKGVKNSSNPAEEFNIRAIAPGGVLRYQQDFDNLIITPISFAKEVLGEYNRVSSIEFYLKEGVDVNSFGEALQNKIGADYIVKNREKQNPTLYKNVRVERWVVFFILTLISVIAIFNIVGSLTMLVLDKQKDMTILKGLGGADHLIQRIFFYEGLMIAVIGCVLGLLIGGIFNYIQSTYGIIRVEDGANTIIDSYPMVSKWGDYVLVFLTVTGISGLVSYFSATLSVRELNKLKTSD